MEGDITSKFRLNISDFNTKLNRVDARLRSTLKKMDRTSISSSAALTREIERLTAAQKKSLLRSVSSHRAASKKLVANAEIASAGFARTWWEGFGRVALGFTLAYRAMMAFEVGAKKVIMTISEAIKESSDLAATQAKLAFWYQMHTKESLKYADVFEMAASNIHALGEASVYSVATLDELTTGIDELAQSVGAVPAHMIPAMASMVDFTVMVAQTTGSTTRQVRQEFQALMEGRIRTTDVMARSLIKTGIMTRAELKQMRDMTNQAEILEKVMKAVHERWTEARDIYREASIEAAKGFWEKALKMNIRLSVNLASELTKTGKVAGNLFAKVFVEHGKRALDDMEKGLHNNVLMMMALRSILDKLLTAFEKTLAGVAWFVASLYRMSDEILFAVKAIGGFFILGVVTKLMAGFGKAAIWLAMGPIKVLRYAVHLVNTSILRIPLVLYATVVSVQALFKTMGMSGEHLKEVFLAIPKALSGMFSAWISELGETFTRLGDIIWEKIPKPVREVLEWIAASIADSMVQIKGAIGTAADFYHPIIRDAGAASKEIGNAFKPLLSAFKTLSSSFGKSFGKNFKDTFLEHMKFLEGVMAPIMMKILGQSEIDYKKMLAKAKKAGLEWLFKEGREESEKEQNARLRGESRLLTLIGQMQKDASISRIAQTLITAETEYQIRLKKIKELAGISTSPTLKTEGFDAYMQQLEKRVNLGIMAVTAYSTKLEQLRMDTLKSYSEKYYAWKSNQIKEDAKALIRAGASEVDVRKWAINETEKLSIESNRHILENSKNLISVTEAAWANFLLESESAAKQFADASIELMETFSRGIGDAFAQSLIYGKNLVTGLQNLAQTIAATIISTLIRVTVEKAIQWALSKILTATEAASRLGLLAAETYAGAFASTVAIPVVGPAMAPVVASTSLAAMLAGTTVAGGLGNALGASLGSFDNGGISKVPGIYYSGIPEAHIPLEGGNVPVKLDEKRPATQVDIVNVLDPVMFDRYLASSRGRDAVVNVVGSRSQSIRRILR